jgi:hypothetical protein
VEERERHNLFASENMFSLSKVEEIEVVRSIVLEVSEDKSSTFLFKKFPIF